MMFAFLLQGRGRDLIYTDRCKEQCKETLPGAGPGPEQVLGGESRASLLTIGLYSEVC